MLGGAIFNLANILLVAAIDIAGMSVAFPVGIGIALVLGVVLNYAADPIGNAAMLFTGVALLQVWRRHPAQRFTCDLGWSTLFASLLMAMIFIPCRDGASHVEHEWTEPAHVAAGAAVLAQVMHELVLAAQKGSSTAYP